MSDPSDPALGEAMDMSSVTVVIPNWNGAVHLRECLDAMRGQSVPPARVIVVDNGSTDDSLAILRAEYPWVEIIETGQNLGFSGAVNRGIGAADTEYVALLNNDTAADQLWLEQLTGALDARPGFDTAASLMVFYDDPAVVNAAGDVYSLQFLAAYNRGMWRSTDRFDEPVRVFGACAGAALYRRSLFADIGLFDESFFLMHEDTDFNIRALVRFRTGMTNSARIRSDTNLREMEIQGQNTAKGPRAHPLLPLKPGRALNHRAAFERSIQGDVDTALANSD